MATPKGKRPQSPAKRPEYKIGPFHNGLGVAIWCNEVQTERGTRYFRSLTIARRRYRDPKDGQWKDATSYRPVDLSTLIIALQSARDYCTRVPLPGQAVEGDEMEELHLEEDEGPGDSSAP